MNNIEPIEKMSIEQQWWYANLLANSEFVPKPLKNKPNEIFITIQYGKELGISPMASVHGIAIINGTPTIYGDLLVSLMIRHEDFEDFNFTFTQTENEGLVCECVVKRKGREPFSTTYSQSDARKAGLDKKANWTNYLKQMLMRRSLNIAFHYVFPDALFTGLAISNTPCGEDTVNEKTLVAQTPLINKKDNAVPKTSDSPLPKVSKPVSPVLSSKKNTDEPVKDMLNSDLPTPEEIDSILEISATSSTTFNNRVALSEYYHQAFNNTLVDDNKYILAILLIVLKEHLNSNEVNEKLVKMVTENGITCTNESLTSDNIHTALSESMIKKTISRLIVWLSKRIKCIEEILNFTKKTGYPETYLIQKSTFALENTILCEYSSKEPKLAFSLEYQKLISEISLEDDLSRIPLEDLMDITDRISLETSIIAKSGQKTISPDLVKELETNMQEMGVSPLVALQPFLDYPDIRLVETTIYDNVVKYCYYLYTIKNEPCDYLTDSEVFDIMEKYVSENKQTSDISLMVCGTRKIEFRTIPKNLMKKMIDGNTKL